MAYYEELITGKTDGGGNAIIQIGPVSQYEEVYFLGYATAECIDGSSANYRLVNPLVGGRLAGFAGQMAVVGPMLLKPQQYLNLVVNAGPPNTPITGSLVGDVHPDPSQLVLRPIPTAAGANVGLPSFPNLTVTGPNADFQQGLRSEGPVLFDGRPWLDPKHPAFAAAADGVIDDTASWLGGTTPAGVVTAGLLATSFAMGGMPIRLGAGDNYLISLPLKVYRLTDTGPSIPPSIIGPGAGSDKFAGHVAAAKFTASSTFPIGEFMIDYLGTQTTPFAALFGFTVGGFAIECQSRSAGFRAANIALCRYYDIVSNESAVPNPANATGAPVGAISLVAIGAPNDYSYDVKLDKIYSVAAAKDGFMLQQGGVSRVVAEQCVAIDSIRYGFNIGDATTLSHCDAQSSGVSDYWMSGGILDNCTELFPTKGNSITIDNAFGSAERVSKVIGGEFRGSSTAGTEAATAMVHQVGWPMQAAIVGATFIAGTQTSDWLYVDAAATTGTGILFEACNFDTARAPLTNKYNLNGTTTAKFKHCPGLNPLGAVATPAFPATTVQIINGTGVDVMAYITNGANPLTVQVDGVAALMVVPANQVAAVKIPAGSTFKPTYGGGAPTWVWYGE